MNEIFILESSRATEATVISVFLHTALDDTFEGAGSLESGGVKQTVRGWGWEARRQTAHSNHHHQGLV